MTCMRATWLTKQNGFSRQDFGIESAISDHRPVSRIETILTPQGLLNRPHHLLSIIIGAMTRSPARFDLLGLPIELLLKIIEHRVHHEDLENLTLGSEEASRDLIFLHSVYMHSFRSSKLSKILP